MAECELEFEVMQLFHHPGVNILHVRHTSENGSNIPLWLIECANAYEGFVAHRIGFNFPAQYWKHPDKKHSSMRGPRFQYVVCYPKRDMTRTFEHELLHALYHVSESYRKFVLKEWNKLNQMEQTKANKVLRDYGYPTEVWLDEWQAYKYSAKDAWNTIVRSFDRE